jgi:large conductance mechanosensitive channel
MMCAGSVSHNAATSRPSQASCLGLPAEIAPGLRSRSAGDRSIATDGRRQNGCTGRTIVIQEFKDFINNGNIFETAVGLILALAFAPVVTGFIDNIIMPIIAAIVGEPNFDNITIGISDAEIFVGRWITTVIGFLLVAIVMFFLVKAYNKSNEAEEEAAGPSEIDLLTEIRDGLAR